LARRMGARSEKDPVRPPPAWEFPEGSNFSKPAPSPPDADPDSLLADPWAVWSSALEKSDAMADKDVPARDPNAETDFWRSAARDVVPEATANAARPEPPALSENASQSEVWGAASEVTASVSELQERLRSELQNFNSYDEIDAYRDIARELVGPAGVQRDVNDSSNDDELDETTPPPVLLNPVEDDDTLGANAGSGWNPDVDWMRFDDVARETQKKRDREQRAAIRDRSEQMRLQAMEGDKEVDDATTRELASFTYTDGDGRTLSADEVEAAIAAGALLVDENDNELDNVVDSSTQATPGPSVVAASARSPKSGVPSSSTYGPSSSGAVNELKALQDQSVELRDPVADKNFWRDAARSIGMVSPVDPLATENMSQEADAASAVVFSAGAPPALPDVAGESVDEKSAWSAWNSGVQRWVVAQEAVPPRDATAEVDMWRSAARDVVPGGLNNASSTSSVRPDDTTNDEVEARSPWTSWSTANMAWESSIRDSNPGEQTPEQWLDAARDLVPDSPTVDLPAEKKDWGSDFQSADSFSSESAGWGSGLQSIDTTGSGWGSGFSAVQKSSGWGSGFTTNDSNPSGEWGAGLDSLEGESRGDAASLLGKPLWSRRSDFSDSRGKPTSTSDDAIWRDAAKGMSSTVGVDNEDGKPLFQTPDAARSGSSGAKEGKGAAIEFWKTLARDIAPQQPNNRVDGDASY
jgi:hypothetical protein